jgi:hypothetical protein
MFTLGATRDRALKQRTLDWAVKSGQVKMQDTFYPLGSVTGSVEGADMAWRYFQEVRVCVELWNCGNSYFFPFTSCVSHLFCRGSKPSIVACQ